MFFPRTAMDGDLPADQSIICDKWIASYGPLEGEDKIINISKEWHSIQRLKEQLAAPYSEFIVADDGQQIGAMGYAVQRDDNDAEILQLHVRSDLHGRQLGSGLIEELESAFHNAKRIVLDVHPENEAAIRFYQRHGYKEFARTDTCGGSYDLPALRMEKKLVWSDE